MQRWDLQSCGNVKQDSKQKLVKTKNCFGESEELDASSHVYVSHDSADPFLVKLLKKSVHLCNERRA